MVRIDHLDSDQFMNLSEDMQQLLLENPELVDSSDSSDDNDNHEPEEHCSFAATRRYPPKKFPREILAAETIIVSCGVTNFEQSAYSQQKSTEFGKWLNPRGRKYNPTEPGILGRPGAKGMFKKSFCENFPDLVKGRDVFLVDCTELNDPEHDKSLRSHLGTHPETLKNIVESDKFPEVNRPLRGLTSRKKNLIGNVCRSGRHRSVGNLEAQSEAVCMNLYDGEEERIQKVHLQADSHWDRVCGFQCPVCAPKGPDNRETLKTAFDILKKIIPVNFGSRSTTHRPRRQDAETVSLTAAPGTVPKHSSPATTEPASEPAPRSDIQSGR